METTSLQTITFLDVNECLRGSHDCHGNATCANRIGSYNCSCDGGFDGNGFNCTGEYSFEVFSQIIELVVFQGKPHISYYRMLQKR